MRRKLLVVVAGTSLLAMTGLRAEELPAEPRGPKRERPRMTEEQRAQAEQRVNGQWARLPVEAKLRVMRLHRALTELPPEERRFIHERIERFLNMPPEERERLEKNRQRWQEMNPEERQRAREEFRRRRQEFEEKWRAEHPGEEPPPFPHRGTRRPPPPPPEDPEPETENPTKETP